MLARIPGPAVLAFVLACVGCGGGNPYGYGRTYPPLDEEEAHLERAVMLSYEEVRREGSAFKDDLLGWFGVVQELGSAGPDGSTMVSLQLRFHQERHLCADQFDSSCRVTISQRTGGPFSARIAVRAEDLKAGPKKLGPGSLLKIYAHPTGEFDDLGGPVLKGVYYRHFPHGTYVTVGRRGNMRR